MPNKARKKERKQIHGDGFGEALLMGKVCLVRIHTDRPMLSVSHVS